MRLLVLLNHFPALSETFVADELVALCRLGHEIRIESGARADPSAELPEPPPVLYLSDDGLRRRVLDVAWLAARHPLGVLADLVARRRWGREEKVHPLRVIAPVARRLARHGERHVHVYFADVACLDALRLHRLLGVTYSVTLYAFEIYQRPTNLREKLEGAAVAFGTAGPVTDDLRAIAPTANLRTHRMGIDARRFERSAPPPGGRHVMAVGRLVEKKGFTHLLDATARLRDEGRPLDRVTIIGDGPLREPLEAQIAALGLQGTVVLAGRREPAEIPRLLHDADVVAMPCVIAADGDRDALPTVVLESLAMRIPVVATDVTGLPEVVQEPWGRMVAQGDAAALAAALGDVLDRPLEEREAMGAAARAFIERERDGATRAAALTDALATLT